MTPQQFIAKWKPARLSERSAAQQHFLDLCDLLDQPTPAAADPEGAWEYKRKHKDLVEAYKQLCLYREERRGGRQGNFGETVNLRSWILPAALGLPPERHTPD